MFPLLTSGKKKAVALVAPLDVSPDDMTEQDFVTHRALLARMQKTYDHDNAASAGSPHARFDPRSYPAVLLDTSTLPADEASYVSKIYAIASDVLLAVLSNPDVMS